MSTTGAGTDVPRDPAHYRPGVHFGARFKDNYEDDRPPRHLDGEIVDGCIERGAATKASRDTYHFEETFGGVTYRLVVNVDSRKVVTGYPVSVDEAAARNSGRWSSAQLADIREFIRTDPR